METENTQKENLSTDSDNLQREFITSKPVIAKSLKDWGYGEAGLNKGEPIAFENRLRWIKAGHIVDESYNVDEELRRKKELDNEITAKVTERSGKETDKLRIKDVIIASKEEHIKKHQANIESKNAEVAEGKAKSQYLPVRFWLYTALCALISVYLIFFYASAMNAAFFRSMQQTVNSNSGDDISLMLNSIFDAKGIFQASAHLLFVYLGSSLFLALAPFRIFFMMALNGNRLKFYLRFYYASLSMV